MKILMVGCDLTSNGGIASVVKSLYAEAERSSAVDFTLVKTTDYKHGNRFSNLLVFLRGFVRFCFAVPGTDVVHLQASSHVSFYRKIPIHVVARLWRKPVLWHLHASRFAEFYIDANGFRRRLIGWAFGSAQAVIVLCSLFRDDLTRSYRLDNVVVLRNPIEEGRYAPPLSGDDAPADQRFSDSALNILFVGFYIPNKGVADLLEVARRCQERHGDRFRFLLGGQGVLAPAIAEFHEAHPQTLIDLGWLDEDAKRSAYRQADLLFLPSYNEGMPIVILEAMEAGLPILSTRIAGIPEEVHEGKNGFLVEPGDIEAMVTALEKFESPERRVEMAAQSRLLVREFHVDRVFEDLIAIYERINPENRRREGTIS